MKNDSSSGCFAWILIAAIVGIVFGVKSCNHSRSVAPFKTHLSSYSAFFPTAEPPLTPYLRGKLVVIDKANRKIDPIMFKLTDRVRATQPKEVKTIARLSRGEVTSGAYTDGAAAVVRTGHLVLIDTVRGQVIHEKSFRGGPPPGVKKAGGKGYGGSIDDLVVSFLDSLPIGPVERFNEPGSDISAAPLPEFVPETSSGTYLAESSSIPSNSRVPAKPKSPILFHLDSISGNMPKTAQAVVTADNTARVHVSVTSKIDEPQTVVVTRGTQFTDKDDGTLLVNMTEVREVLPPRGTKRISCITAYASAKLPKQISFPKKTLQVASPISIQRPLGKLCRFAGWARRDQRIRQLSVLTIVHRYRDFSDLSLPAVGLDTPPTKDEMVTVGQLLSEAGLTPDDYRALDFALLPTHEIRNALRDRIVSAEVRGGGLTSVRVEIRSLSKQTVRITVPRGTVFNSNSSRIQNMLAVKQYTVRIEPDKTATMSVSVTCMNMNRDAPKSSDRLSIGGSSRGDLERLVALDEYQSASFRVRQFAVWTITNNPKRNGYMGIGSFGFGSGPSDKELGEIRKLFSAAGISTQRYYGLADSGSAASRRRAASRSTRSQAPKTETIPVPKFEVIDRKATSRQLTLLVRLTPQSSKNPTRAHLSEIANRLKPQAKRRRTLFFFYLPEMKPTSLPWGVVSHEGGKERSVKIYPRRLPKRSRAAG